MYRARGFSYKTTKMQVTYFIRQLFVFFSTNEVSWLVSESTAGLFLTCSFNISDTYPLFCGPLKQWTSMSRRVNGRTHCFSEMACDCLCRWLILHSGVSQDPQGSHVALLGPLWCPSASVWNWVTAHEWSNAVFMLPVQWVGCTQVNISFGIFYVSFLCIF